MNTALSLIRRSPSRPQAPNWALVDDAQLGIAVDCVGISMTQLESRPVDRQVVRQHVEALMTELEVFTATRSQTPGGASWIHIHHVPVRRLLGQLIRKLVLLGSWSPFTQEPGKIHPAPYEGLVGVRAGSASEYRHYTVTWSGLAYVLGAEAPHNPPHSARLVREQRSTKRPTRHHGNAPAQGGPAEVLALSWSSRHAQTLLPVLTELRRRGQASVLLDLATDPSQHAVVPQATNFTIMRAPDGLLDIPGTVPGLGRGDEEQEGHDHFVNVVGHEVRLRRLEHLAAAMLELSAGCTQPSWLATVETEAWLQAQLDAVQPRTVLVSNDISPLGALALHAAERFGAVTVNIQHGAWSAEAVSRPALHARHQVVMGERDAVLACDWVRHPEAEIHVLGQPRFDTLAALSRAAQRRYLLNLLNSTTKGGVQHVLVLACQPFGPLRLLQQLYLLFEGLRAAKERWGLVLAPHPAQDPDTLATLLVGEGVPVAIADRRVGARGCLAGADAVASVASTCGLEAALLDVPVLELAANGEPTLGLAEYDAAHACATAQDITTALDSLAEGPRLRPAVGADGRALDAVCRWRGTTSADIADLILTRSTADPAAAGSTDNPAPAAVPGVPGKEGELVR